MVKRVSVIISTYNRYELLLLAIESIKNQTYKNIEIIVINDNSTDNQYYSTKIKDIIMIHLDKNTKEIFNYPCAGYVRNIGLKICTGYYITFLDDDDFFLPSKIETQVKFLNTHTNIHMCCTEAYIGIGMYIKNNNYKMFNQERFWNFLKNKLNLEKNFPNLWNLQFIMKHNTIITSSIMLRKELISKIGFMKTLPNGYEDYDYWLRSLHYTNCYFIKQPLIYYNSRN